MQKTKFNKEQLDAINHEYGPCFVSACPGSGKTTVIVERTRKLIEKGHNPKNILCITFTNKAAKEMKERLHSKIGDAAIPIYISTFHALCATILRKYGQYLGYDSTLSILDDEDQIGLLAQCARQNNHEIDKFRLKSMLWKLNDLRESLINEEKFEEEFDILYEAAICKEYLNRMRKSKQIDFSGLLSETIRLLEKDSEVLTKLQHRFDFLQVDETQDTNLAQFKLLQMLGAHDNLFIVGDLDQSIYSWRGARYQNIEEFVRDKKATVIPLPENYRSTPQIIKTAATLIAKNKNRQTEVEFRTSNPNGEPVELFCLRNSEDEAKWIADRIYHLVSDKKYAPQDIAILYRLNSMSRSIEQALMARNISYHVIGGFSFYDRTEIKDCVAMLRFALNPLDGLALSRFINKPTSKIGEVTVGQIENFAQQNNISILETLSRADTSMFNSKDKLNIVARCKKIADAYNFDVAKMGIGEILNRLIIALDYNRYLESKFDDKELVDRKNNVQEFINASALWSNSSKDLSGYLTSIALQSSADKESEENCVSLMSLHSSKGLEFPVVFMPCLEDGELPHARAIQERDGLEEERRLCYVGMTRAKKKLYISYAQTRMQNYKFGEVKYANTKPSRFLAEADILKTVQFARLGG